jgi:hypothetical protein
MRSYNKRVFNPLQDLLLVFNVINVLALDDFCLLHALYGILMVSLCFEPAHADITESTYTKKFNLGLF